MQEFWHKIVTSSPNSSHRLQVRLATIFVLIWFVMDTIEFTDWVIGKFKPEPARYGTIIVPSSPPPNFQFFQSAPTVDPTRNREI
jgi:hypothetical protein